MLDKKKKIAIYMEGHLFSENGKMGFGALRYLSNPIVAVIDSENEGKNISEITPISRDVPIIKNIDIAIDNGAEVLLLGIANSGGQIPKSWFPIINLAIEKGLSIINGLHNLLALKYSKKIKKEQWIWDVRVPQFIPEIASRKAATLKNKRILCVGTDMAVGKMTTSLELYKWAKENKIKCGFIATGQIGITVTGSGIPLDAYKVDHACGAVEQMVMDQSSKDWILIEGQGSLLHPGSTATIPLLRGSCPTHLILCDRSDINHLRDHEGIKKPNLKNIISLYENIACCHGIFPEAKVIGISLNTSNLDSVLAKKMIDFWESETKLPVSDVVRYGPKKLGDAIKNF